MVVKQLKTNMWVFVVLCDFLLLQNENGAYNALISLIYFVLFPSAEEKVVEI